MSKRITLLATGGTIACRRTPDGLSPALHASELLQDVPVREDIEIVCRDVFSMDSSISWVWFSVLYVFSFFSAARSIRSLS